MLRPREKQVLDTTIDLLKQRLAPPRIFLFGSRAKGHAQKGADFDIAVDSPRPSLRIERQLLEEVNESVGLYKVDIVYLKSVDKEFQDIILRTGKIIYEE